jgi:hypothetical protein
MAKVWEEFEEFKKRIGVSAYRRVGVRANELNVSWQAPA